MFCGGRPAGYTQPFLHRNDYSTKVPVCKWGGQNLPVLHLCYNPFPCRSPTLPRAWPPGLFPRKKPPKGRGWGWAPPPVSLLGDFSSCFSTVKGASSPQGNAASAATEASWAASANSPHAQGCGLWRGSRTAPDRKLRQKPSDGMALCPRRGLSIPHPAVDRHGPAIDTP